MENNVDLFEKNGYCLVDNAVDEGTCKSLSRYAMIVKQSETVFGDSQVPGTHSKYADPMFEKLLFDLVPKIEENTGKKVFPTYSYYRIYKPGDILEAHKDRESCEISATLCIDYNYEDEGGSWPIKIGENSFSMEPGDMIIYRGIDISHSRDVFVADEGCYHVQAFLHYVDSEGPYSEWKFDKRNV